MRNLDKKRLDILIENEVNQLTQEQIDWLNECCSEDAKHNSYRGTWYYKNGVVNIRGNFSIGKLGFDKKFSSLPVKFGKASGNFWLNVNELTSLKDCPIEVGGDFACNHNQLTSLEYMPKKIGGLLYCYSNPFNLNDKFFQILGKIGRRKLGNIGTLFSELRKLVPIQFGITDQDVLDDIWGSYMRIFNNEKK